MQTRMLKLSSAFLLTIAGAFTLFSVSGCKKQAEAPAGAPAMQALPVQTVTISSTPVPKSDEYVATIKSRRSATLTPQVVGNLTAILVRSGDHVKAGQPIMEIDPIKQKAAVDSQVATERQKLALYHYNEIEVGRQRKLFEAGVVSRDTLDGAEQAYSNSKADYESAVASRKTQEETLGYYHIRAPFDGVIGDVPVHIGDYVSDKTTLTTVDENRDFEAYIYIPTERGGETKPGLGVDILDNNGQLIEKTTIDFISPQVDDGIQGILAKAKIHSPAGKVRTAQLVKARVIWSTAPAATVPVLAVTRLGGQTFVYVAQSQGNGFAAKQRVVSVGDTIGNQYTVLSGLKDGDRVIVSGTQFLQDGAPVQPLG